MMTEYYNSKRIDPTLIIALYFMIVVIDCMTGYDLWRVYCILSEFIRSYLQSV